MPRPARSGARRPSSYRSEGDGVDDLPSFASRLLGSLRGSLAVDLGTANTVVFVRGEGIVLFEPSVIAIDDETNEVLAVGAQAKEMIGRTPGSIRATRPLRHGVISDFDVTEQMLRNFIARAIGNRRVRPRVVLCVPSGLTGVERDAVQDATLAAGAADVSLIEEAVAAAIGADLPIAEPVGSMIVDIGGGTTEVGVISLGGLVVGESVRVGGYEMDDAIVRHVKNEHRLLVGGDAAEVVKIAVGSAWSVGEEGEAEIRGRDLSSGLLRRKTLTAAEVRYALAGTIERIVDAVKATLERAPAELAADVMQRGLVLAGGGALLRGMDECLRHETGLAVTVVDSPLTCVAIGAGRSLEEVSVDPSYGPWRRRRRTGARAHRPP
jgi:rod shape-determining protein MreB and related proteins